MQQGMKLGQCGSPAAPVIVERRVEGEGNKGRKRERRLRVKQKGKMTGSRQVSARHGLTHVRG